MLTGPLILCLVSLAVLVCCATSSASGFFGRRDYMRKVETHRLAVLVHDYLLSGQVDSPPLRGTSPATGDKELMCVIISLLRNDFSDYSAEKISALSEECGLERFLVERAERSRGERMTEYLRLAASLPVSDNGASRLLRLRGRAVASGELCLTLLEALHWPRRAAAAVERHSGELTEPQAAWLAERLYGCSGGCWKRFLRSSSPNALRVGMHIVGVRSLHEGEEAVYDALLNSDKAVRKTAFKVLPMLKSQLSDPRVTSAACALDISERKRLYRYFVREGYSAKALRPVIESEQPDAASLAGMVKAAMDCRRRVLGHIS